MNCEIIVSVFSFILSIFVFAMGLGEVTIFL